MLLVAGVVLFIHNDQAEAGQGGEHRQAGAEDDVGAVLGWEGLMTRAVQGGRLVALVPEGIPSPVAFSLRLNPRASAKARLFADWLVQSA